MHVLRMRCALRKVHWLAHVCVHLHASSPTCPRELWLWPSRAAALASNLSVNKKGGRPHCGSRKRHKVPRAGGDEPVWMILSVSAFYKHSPYNIYAGWKSTRNMKYCKRIGQTTFEFNLRFWIWASQVPFFGTEKPLKMAVFGCKKMGLGMPKSKNGDHFLSPTIPKNGGIDSCFAWISFSGEFWANFENRVF